MPKPNFGQYEAPSLEETKQPHVRTSSDFNYNQLKPLQLGGNTSPTNEGIDYANLKPLALGDNRSQTTSNQQKSTPNLL